MILSFDFTIAVQPALTTIDKELQYIKSALLYADKIILISPMVYMYTQLTTGGANFDERRIIKLLKWILPMCREREPDTYREGMAVVDQLSRLMYSKQYKSIPVLKKIELRNQLKGFMEEMDDSFIKMMGESQTAELNLLLKSGKLVLQKFEHNLADVNGCVSEYFGFLTKSVKTSIPLFDEASNSLMRAAMNSKIISLSESEKKKITHAGLSDNLIQRLPSFDTASVDEIIDIRKGLDGPLIRFRSKVLSYAESIQSLPWDDDFEYKCSMLYDKDVAPAVQEIDELSRENSFVRNLTGKIASDERLWESVPGLAISVAAGFIPSFTDAISADTAILATGGAWAAQKIVATYKEHQEKKREISKKDLYFYYKAGKRLSK